MQSSRFSGNREMNRKGACLRGKLGKDRLDKPLLNDEDVRLYSRYFVFDNLI
jgi:hypothetical protein